MNTIIEDSLQHCIMQGNAYIKNRQLTPALRCFHKALEFKPDSFEIHVNLGNIYQELKEFEKAIQCYQKALTINIASADVYYNMGSAFQSWGKPDHAVECYQNAIRLNAGYAQAWHNMGNALKTQGKIEDAIQCYQKALEINPNMAEVFNNMGIAFHALGNITEALECYSSSLNIRPTFSKPFHNMGNLFRDMSMTDNALKCYQKAFEITNDFGIKIKQCLTVPVIPDSTESIENHRKRIIVELEALANKGIKLEDPYNQVGIANFYLAYHGLNDKSIQQTIASFYLRVCPDLNQTLQKPRKKKPGDKIRVGIVSAFFHDHTIGRLYEGIIKYLCRKTFDIAVFRFPGIEDHISSAIDNAADAVIRVPKNLPVTRQIIANSELDILFYPDIGMEPFTYFLAFSRLAPVQCTGWGHPVTTGIPNMDYFISTSLAENFPDAETHYSERLVLLKKFSMYCYKPELPEKRMSREMFDIHRDRNLYVCPQNLFKFHPNFDSVLGDILRQDTHGMLILFDGKYEYWGKLLRQRFVRTFPDVVDRVRFMPYLPINDFLAFLRDIADVILDTPYFTGGYTSILAFAAGAPVVTCAGTFMRSRLTSGFYRQMEINECVADDFSSYSSIAIRLANDRAWNENIRRQIKERSRILYEDIEAVHDLGNFFKTISAGF